MRESWDPETNEEVRARLETEFVLVPREAQLLLNELPKRFVGEFKFMTFENAGTTVIAWRLHAEKVPQEHRMAPFSYSMEIKRQIQAFVDGWFAAIDLNLGK